MTPLPVLPPWQISSEAAHVAWPGAEAAWAAWVPEWPLSALWWRQVLAADPQLKKRRLLWLVCQGEPLAFALLSPNELDPNVGHVDLLAVAPSARRQGLGRALGEAALRTLATMACRHARWGAALHHAFPGAPLALEGAWPLAQSLGFVAGRDVHDLLGPTHQSPSPWPEAWRLRPCQSEDRGPLLAFLEAHFPGRWHRDVALALAQGMPIAQVMGAFDPQGQLKGFAWTHPPDAPGAARWQALRPGCGAVGPLGLAPECRKLGLGLGLTREALACLAGQGVDQAVIDWTDLVDFYARLGFVPEWTHRQAERPLHQGEPL